MKQYTVGIDIGCSNTFLAVFDEKMNAVGKLHRATDTELTPEQLVSSIDSCVRDLLNRTGISIDDIRGIGAAFPSHIDFKRGTVIETCNMPTLTNIPVRDLLEQSLNCPVWIDNDANAAALAEHKLGAGRRFDDMIYVTVSTGIGGGLILNGKLYRGIHGAAGEIGHMFVSDSIGYQCGCGVTGCVQSISSGLSMAQYAINLIKEGADSSILRYAGTFSRIDMIAVARAFRDGDEVAREVMTRGAEYLGRMFHSLYQIFDINVFVYGGGVIKAGEEFVEMFKKAYSRYSQMELKYPALFLPAELGDDAAMIGAALLVQ